jgi:hypothetical protein
MIRILFILLTVALISQGCLTDPDCVTTTRNFVTVNFYSTETNERDTLFFTSVTTIGSDTLLASNQDVRSIQLPLDSRQPMTTYVFNSNLDSDTLVLIYNLGTRLISDDCGLEFVFTEVDYARNDFDSISIVNNVPLEGIAEDIRIYN